MISDTEQTLLQKLSSPLGLPAGRQGLGAHWLFAADFPQGLIFISKTAA